MPLYPNAREASARAKPHPDPDDRAALLEGARLDLERDIIALAAGGIARCTNAATLRDLAFTLEILDRRTGERDAILAAHAAEVADLEAQVETLDARLTRLAGIANSACVAAHTVNASYLEPAALAPLRAALEALDEELAELLELEETSAASRVADQIGQL